MTSYKNLSVIIMTRNFTKNKCKYIASYKENDPPTSFKHRNTLEWWQIFYLDLIGFPIVFALQTISR